MERYVQAGKFKAECLKIMDEVQKTKRPVIITKRNIPVVEIVPIPNEKKSLYGAMEGSMEIIGDIIAPIDEKWDANS